MKTRNTFNVAVSRAILWPIGYRLTNLTSAKKKIGHLCVIAFLCLLALLPAAIVSAQYNTHQNDVWAFAYSGGINFNPGPSPASFSSNSSVYEGTSAMCDAAGNLLLYAADNNVYDRFGSYMPHGMGVCTVPYFSTSSTTQGTVIVPVIGNINQYYVFFLQDYGTAGLLTYCIVDMTLNSGLGDVITSPVVTHDLATGLSEGMTVVKGTNCNIWLLVHRRNTSDFLAYSITSQGIGDPVISPASAHNVTDGYKRGSIKVSPDRKKIAHCSTDASYGLTPGLEVLDFNAATGVVSNSRLINSYSNQYDAEFSPSSNKLYARPIDGQIYQYDLSAPTTAASIAASEFLVTNYATPDRGGEMKLGPDGMIYCQTNAGYLDRIQYPDLTGSSCNYTNHTVSLGGHTGIGLVNMALAPVTTYPAPITGTFTVCAGSTTILHDATPGGIWSSSNTSVSTIDGSGTLGGVSPGTGTITYTVPAMNCYLTVHDTVQPGAVINGSSLCVGSAANFSASSPGGTWTSSDMAIATVSPAGSVTGVSAGTANITYTMPGGCFATYVLTVAPPPSPITGLLNICQGTISHLSQAVPGGTWSSSSLSVATIDASGTMGGVHDGTATITYQLPGMACKVTAIANIYPLPVITGSPVCIGSMGTFTALPTGGTWSGGNPSIATIDAMGNVYSVAVGTTSVTYTSPAGCVQVAPVNIVPLPAPITGNTTGCAGTTWQLTDQTPGGYWTSSTPAVATIDISTGWVTAISPGTTTITYHAPSTGCTITTVITVYPVPVITGSSAVCPGTTISLYTSIAGGTWSSDAPTIATVDPLTGVVTGISIGSATIYYTSPSGCVGILKITVKQPPSPVISNPRHISPIMCQGETMFLRGETGTDGGTISWASSDPSIVSISTITSSPTLSNCYLNAVSPGTAVISYSLTSGCTSVATYTVTVLPNAHITTPPATCFNTTPISLSATPPGGTWFNLTPAIATIDASGTVFPITPGIATIQYTAPGYCTAIVGVTLNPIPAPKFTNTVTDICTGSAVYEYANPGTSDIGSYTWTSSNPSVAVVSGSPTTAVVTPLSAGTTTITLTVTTSAGCTGYATLTINVHAMPAPITGSTLICQGSVSPLSNTVPGGFWYSSNTAIATVDPVSGVVTGVSGGTATITYATGNTCMATINVTVIYACMDIYSANLITVIGTPGATVTVARYDASGTLISTTPGVPIGANIITAVGPAPRICIISMTYSGVTCPVNCCVHSIGGGGAYAYGPKPAGHNTGTTEENNLTISPNPSHGELTISGDFTTQSESADIEILDMTGKVVVKESVPILNNHIDKNITLDKNIPNGVYILKIGSNDANAVYRFTLEH